MQLAIFQCGIGRDSYQSYLGKIAEQFSDYVRISEYVDVEFPTRSKDEVIEKQLAAINAAETALRNKFQTALNSIERQRAELMALPNLETAT